LEKLRKKKWLLWVLAIVLFLLCLASRVCLAYFYPVDGPGDGVVYTQLAKNLLEHNVFSLESEAPFTPTLVRLPGYPLFIAGVYAVVGHDNNTAVRIVQAVFDAATCVIVALLAWLWTSDEERKWRNALWTFLLTAVCPFIAIYTACLLTETMTTFLMVAMVLTATLAFRSGAEKTSALWWIFTGLLAGAAVLLRPDSGLFALGIGSTLVISGLFLNRAIEKSFSKRLWQVVWKGGVFSLTFIAVLTPWTIRNERLFGVFQPLAPAHAEMPGEFVPHGYDRWLRTWVDDSRFIEPMLWNLDEKPILMSAIPERDFDSPEERTRVAALLDQYNHPPGFENQYESAATEDESDASSDDDTSEQNTDESANNSSDSDDDEDSTEDQDTAASSEELSSDDIDEDKTYVVKMTPGIDAQFAEIADERIARAPFRYYLFLPAKRAAALWFDSHSLYYPFGGQMSPVSDLDYDVDQQYWLPAFTALMWLYTLLGVGGTVVLWRRRSDENILRWLILLALMTLPRIIFFSTVENPEPRYVVELFAFTAILGGFFLGNLRLKHSGSVDEISAREPRPDRLVSLDVFRGVTIAAMILVNEPGSWSAIYPPLVHAEWNGVTPADWIFPFFLFIVGISITFSLGKQIDSGDVGRRAYYKIFRRAVVLFALGILLEAFPFYNIWTASWFDPATLRIMGVLQRIAICYLAASLVFLHTNRKRQALIAAAILLAYWALMTLINVPDCAVTTIDDRTCNLAAYIDRVILGTNHIWAQSTVFDPEGILSTFPAIATTLAGVLTGQWLRSVRSGSRKFAGMIFAGVILTFTGWLWSFWFPLNKSLWTSSYVVYTAGLALCFLAVCYWLCDLKCYRKWSMPFLVFGSNSIVLYAGATVIGKTLETIEIPTVNDKTILLQEKIFNELFLPFADPMNASLFYAVSFVLVSLLFLWSLYRWKILIKI
jgi:predicted acyltransferase/4-amino-4-deoxy-L-arabinose transferase-like glycosyltransferase